MKRLLLVAALFITGTSQADDDTNYCLNYTVDAEAKSLLPEVAVLAEDIVGQFCNLESKEINNLSKEILSLAEFADDTFKSIGMSNDMFPFSGAVGQLRNNVMKGQAINDIGSPDNPNTPGLNFDGDILITDVSACDRSLADTGKSQASSCEAVIEAFKKIYEYAQILVRKADTAAVKKYLDLNRAAWNSYYEKSRYQTVLERFINGKRWAKKKEAGSFLMPPENQIIFLRPSPVIENVSDAADGEQTEEALMIEFVGINYWRRDKWYQLSGASAVSIFSDRAGTKDWGYGVVLHFGNKLSIGASNRDGDSGYFVSVDVLEFIKDKKKLLSSHLEKLTTGAAVQ